MRASLTITTHLYDERLGDLPNGSSLVVRSRLTAPYMNVTV